MTTLATIDQTQLGYSCNYLQLRFDNGARFKNGQASIPPPPPGCLPNAAQVATAQGANVQISQDKRSKLVGDNEGGVTFW